LAAGVLLEGVANGFGFAWVWLPKGFAAGALAGALLVENGFAFGVDVFDANGLGFAPI
jgi:hypothetical protein